MCQIVQARMWAQGITIGVLLAAGAMTQANKIKNNDDSSIYRHVTNTVSQTMLGLGR